MNTSPEISAPKFSSTEMRALDLLSTGIDAVQVAGALGLSESRISQLISNPDFATELSNRRYVQLAKHNETDNLADKVEKKILEKLDKSIELVFNPMQLAQIYTRLNQAKRRGASTPDAIQSNKRTIALNIPIAIIQHFATNAAGQVVEAGTDGTRESLVTIQSGNMQRLLNDATAAQQDSLPVLITRADRENARRDERNALKESDGKVWNKPQGREKHDVLAECGFTHEVEISSPTSSGSVGNS